MIYNNISVSSQIEYKLLHAINNTIKDIKLWPTKVTYASPYYYGDSFYIEDSKFVIENPTQLNYTQGNISGIDLDGKFITGGNPSNTYLYIGNGAIKILSGNPNYYAISIKSRYDSILYPEEVVMLKSGRPYQPIE